MRMPIKKELQYNHMIKYYPIFKKKETAIRKKA